MSVYNKEKPEFFDASLNSMVHQTILPEQIIIVEDGPLGEQLKQVEKKYIQQYGDMFTVVPIETNSGLANALNKGLDKSRNEYVARMDSDDISLPDRCEKELKEFIIHPELSIVGSDMDEFLDSPEIIISRRVVPRTEEEIIKFGRRRNPFNHPSVMFRLNDVVKCGGYNIKRKRAQDYELFVTMVNLGFHAKNIPESLLKFRSNSGSIKRRKKWSHCKAHIDVVKTLCKKGYSSVLDVIVVFGGQIIMFVVPESIARVISNNILRRK